MSGRTTAPAPAVVWHDVECGAYAADLPLWEELAAAAAAPVLDLGCGTGRVALRLARAGFAVTALDREPELLAELERKAAAEGLGLATVLADARELRLSARFGLIIAPMQLVHLLGGAGGRAVMLRGSAGHLAPGGRLAVALLADARASHGSESPATPDVIEREGWVYSSLPVEVRPLDDGLEVRRLRQIVSPSGDLREELDATRLDRVDAGELEAEAARAGLERAGRRSIAPTREHVGSTVVVLEAP